MSVSSQRNEGSDKYVMKLLDMERVSGELMSGTPLSDGQPQAMDERSTQMSRGLKDVKHSTYSFFHIPKGLLSRGQTDKQRTRKQQRIDIGTTNNATTYAARDRCLRRGGGS